MNQQNPSLSNSRSRELKYCPKCGHALAEAQPEGEDRPRLVCTSSVCSYIFYENPRIIAAALPLVEGRVVLLRRGIEPRHGFWTFPSGFMELHETAEQAAVRESKEETNLDVEITSLLGVYTRVEVGTVAIVYLARVVGGEPQLNHEALEITHFHPHEIPWDDLAFQSTHWALRDWANGVTGRDLDPK